MSSKRENLLYFLGLVVWLAVAATAAYLLYTSLVLAQRPLRVSPSPMPFLISVTGNDEAWLSPESDADSTRCHLWAWTS